ncbi:MAG: multicopper oxidase family protein [Rhizobiales bacterium]|nr:multicopper oxidase family protein [Hyphomicrobiales bacterium]
MMNWNPDRPSRRTLLKGVAALTATAALPGLARAKEAPARLRVESRTLEVKGKAAKVYGILNADGGHGLNKVFDGRFAASLSNGISEDTMVHWHGLAPPVAQDGTPMLSGPPLKPGETVQYDFPIRATGTHWMHSHVGLQEQLMLAAPLIIRESATPLVDEQEHVVMLHDFTFRSPQEILSELQGGGGAHAAHASGGMGHGAMDHGSMDHGNMDHGNMQMGGGAASAAMVNDIIFDAFLANDRTLDDPEVVQAEKGGLFRLRVINASAASNMWIDLGELSGELIAVDGQSIHPHRASRFPVAIAQRADIRLQLPKSSGAWPVLFKAEGSTGQSGIILRAGDGAVSRLSDQGEMQPALDLAMEAQLRPMGKTPDTAVSRVEMLMLTGGGSNYKWGLNGKSSMHDVLFNVREGERYEVMFHNMTTMAHPMHLHGHYFKVVDINGTRIDGAIRDTVLVPVNGMVTIQFDADNPGTWAFHCHHIYHMNAGMMGAIAYANAA